MISLLDKDDTELLELVTHTFKEGLRNNVVMPGTPSLRSKMLNLIEVSLTCYNNHKEHEEHHHAQEREAHIQFQSRITSPVTNRSVIDNSTSVSVPLSASSSLTSSRVQKRNRNVTRNGNNNENLIVNHNDTMRTSSSASSSSESINENTPVVPIGASGGTTIVLPFPPENVNLSSPLMEERRTRRAASMDETDISPNTNSREERANRRRSASMDESASPIRKKQKTIPSKRGRSLGITPQKELFSVGDSVFSCWWSNGPHQSQGYFSCKITKVHGDGKKYDVVYELDGKKGQRIPRSFIKRTKP